MIGTPQDVPRVGPIDRDLLQVACAAYSNTSFDPDRYGKRVHDEYICHLNDSANQLFRNAAEPQQREIAISEFERYSKKYREKLLAALHADARCASSMITGPANFPAERNRKRMEIAHKRWGELYEWSEKAIGKIRDRICDAMSDYAKEKQSIERSRSMVSDTLVKWERRGYCQQSKILLNNRIATMANNGELSAVEAALDVLRSHPKQYYTSRHNVWKLADQCKSVIEARKNQKTGCDEVFQADGVRVVENHDADRLQILFDEKPDENTRGILRGSGWRWSPKHTAWQRKLTGNAKLSAERILQNWKGGAE